VATKTLKRFILVAVLCLWATPAWATITCTVTAGVTNCILTGAGKEMADILAEGKQFGIIAQQSGTSNWVLGNIDPSLQPVAGLGGCSTFRIGDDVTATDLTSINEQVYVTNGCNPQIETNASLTLGRLEGDYGTDGSTWRMQGWWPFYLMSGGDLNLYASTLRFGEGSSTPELRGVTTGTFTAINSMVLGGRKLGSVARLRFRNLAGITIDELFVSGMAAAEFDVGNTFDSVNGFHIHYFGTSIIFFPNADITLENLRITEYPSWLVKFSVLAAYTVTILNPLSDMPDIHLDNNGILEEAYHVGLFIGDKDTEPESGVSVILKRSNLVKGSSGNSVFLCTTSHTSTADTTPITGADWADYWRVFFSGSTEVTVAGGDHRTGVAYEADAERFNVLTGTSGYIAQQQVTFKKWSTTSEYLDTWLHELTLQKTGFETLTQSIYINEQKDLWYEVLDPAASAASDVLIEVGAGRLFRRLADPVIVPLQ